MLLQDNELVEGGILKDNDVLSWVQRIRSRGFANCFPQKILGLGV